jgi:hypothetical protein
MSRITLRNPQPGIAKDKVSYISSSVASSVASSSTKIEIPCRKGKFRGCLKSHCEGQSPEAISPRKGDCFAPLAMTKAELFKHPLTLEMSYKVRPSMNYLNGARTTS